MVTYALLVDRNLPASLSPFQMKVLAAGGIYTFIGMGPKAVPQALQEVLGQVSASVAIKIG